MTFSAGDNGLFWEFFISRVGEKEKNAPQRAGVAFCGAKGFGGFAGADYYTYLTVASGW